MKENNTVLLIQRRYHTNQHPIVKSLQDEGHNVRFLALKQEQSETYSTLNPDFLRYSVAFLFLQRIFSPLINDEFQHRYGFPSFIWYYRYLSETDPDIIIIKKYFLTMILTIFYARILDIDIIFYDQSPLYGDKVRYHKRKIAAYIYYFLNREPFVRITPVLGHEGCDIARPRSYYVPFVAPTWLSPDERSYLEDGYVDIVMIGKLHQERKNHLMLVDVIDELEATYRLRLTIIGSLVDDSHPYYQRLLAYVDNHGLTETVTIKQNLSYHDVQQEYRCHDLYVLPSRDEPAAVSHLEATNAGLPVICSDSNGTRHYIEKEKNGYLFSCGNRDDLARNVERIVASEERVRSFGRRSLELAQTEYSPEKFYDRLSDIISDNF